MDLDPMQTQSLDADFYESHRDDLMRYATALVGLNDAADVVSRVIVRILSKRNRHLRDPRGYAMKAVLNEARSWLRRRRTAPLIDADTAVDHPDPVPEVVTAVMELPVRQRAAVYLVYWIGMSPSEAAGVMGIQPGTARRYLYLARQQLREALSDE
jgi:RNA polymerase sigma factor (sigma-70 family)